MMVFFKKRKQEGITKLKVEEIKVATTSIVSSYDDGMGAGPMCVKWYFAVIEVNGKYYEVFSKRPIEKKTDTCSSRFTIKNFDEPCIEYLDPLKKYLKNPNEKVIEAHALFDFILKINVEKELLERSQKII